MKFEIASDLLSTRTDGEKYRNILLQEYRVTGHCEVNFEGINSITPSFADELFAKLTQEIGASQFTKSVTIKNANKEVKSAIIFAINNRNTLNERDGRSNSANPTVL